jgi:hypothetical protein
MAGIDPPNIPPGGNAVLRATWNLAGKHGPVSEALFFNFSGPNGVRGTVVARLTATVRDPIETEPEVLALDAARRSGVVTLRSPTGRPFHCLAAAACHPCLAATVGTAGDSVNVAFDPAVPGWQPGLMQVTVVTDHPDSPDVSIRVRVQ